MVVRQHADSAGRRAHTIRLRGNRGLARSDPRHTAIRIDRRHRRTLTLHEAVTVVVLPLDIVAVTVNVSDWLIFKRSVEEVIASPVTVGEGPVFEGPSLPPPHETTPRYKNKGDEIPFHRDLHLSWIDSPFQLRYGRRPEAARVATASTSHVQSRRGLADRLVSGSRQAHGFRHRAAPVLSTPRNKRSASSCR